MCCFVCVVGVRMSQPLIRNENRAGASDCGVCVVCFVTRRRERAALFVCVCVSVRV